MSDEAKEGNYLKRVHRALARLHFGDDLQGSNWFSKINRESIGRTVHYGNQLFVSDSPLTLGGLIDAHPDYVTDACERVLAAEKTMARERFLASFLELVLTAEQNKKLGISKAIEQLDSASNEKCMEMMKSYLVARQIPAENLYLAVGIYILQKAKDRGIISLTDKITYQASCQQLEAGI